MAVWLEIETGVIGKGGTKGGVERRGLGGRGKGLVVFVALMGIWVYFLCCSGGCLRQGLQGAGVCTVVHSAGGVCRRVG
jgi:hypothetical protein